MNATADIPPRPLAGCRVLVGRARHQASALSDALRLLGAEVIEIPFIEIREPSSWRPLDEAIGMVLGENWNITNAYLTEKQIDFELDMALSLPERAVTFEYRLSLSAEREALT